MATPSRDDQLDAVALIEAHIDLDNEAASAILANCDPVPVANLLAYLLSGVLTGLAEREGTDPMRLITGLDRLRDIAVQGGDEHV